MKAMFKIAIGASQDPDAAQAIGDAVAQALAGLDGADAQAGLLLNRGHRCDATLLKAIDDTWPGLKLIGCTGDTHQDERSIHLLLLSSPDLIFHLSSASSLTPNAELAAERALADFMPQAEHLALYLQLREQDCNWQHRFEQTLARLLPDHCSDLRSLLPPLNWPDCVEQYYLGRSVIQAPCPLLLACHRADESGGWRMTRQPGILRKKQGDTAWIYDTLVGDRRRKPAA